MPQLPQMKPSKTLTNSPRVRKSQRLRMKPLLKLLVTVGTLRTNLRKARLAKVPQLTAIPVKLPKATRLAASSETPDDHAGNVSATPADENSSEAAAETAAEKPAEQTDHTEHQEP